MIALQLHKGYSMRSLETSLNLWKLVRVDLHTIAEVSLVTSWHQLFILLITENVAGPFSFTISNFIY